MYSDFSRISRRRIDFFSQEDWSSSSRSRSNGEDSIRCSSSWNWKRTRRKNIRFFRTCRTNIFPHYNAERYLFSTRFLLERRNRTLPVVTFARVLQNLTYNILRFPIETSRLSRKGSIIDGQTLSTRIHRSRQRFIVEELDFYMEILKSFRAEFEGIISFLPYVYDSNNTRAFVGGHVGHGCLSGARLNPIEECALNFCYTENTTGRTPQSVMSKADGVGRWRFPYTSMGSHPPPKTPPQRKGISVCGFQGRVTVNPWISICSNLHAVRSGSVITCGLQNFKLRSDPSIRYKYISQMLSNE